MDGFGNPLWSALVAGAIFFFLVYSLFFAVRILTWLVRNLFNLGRKTAAHNPWVKSDMGPSLSALDSNSVAETNPHSAREGKVPPWALWLSLLLLAIIGFSLAEHFRHPWGWVSTSIVETLDSPIRIRSWDKEGMTLADGRFVRLPEVKVLPSNCSPLFCESTRQGVELSPEGRVFGLLRIHHWCGNDSVRTHVAKVDLSRLLLFTGEGEPIRPLSRNAKECSLSQASLGDCGWRIEEFLEFQSWNKLIEVGAIKLFQE